MEKDFIVDRRPLINNAGWLYLFAFIAIGLSVFASTDFGAVIAYVFVGLAVLIVLKNNSITLHEFSSNRLSVNWFAFTGSIIFIYVLKLLLVFTGMMYFFFALPLEDLLLVEEPVIYSVEEKIYTFLLIVIAAPIVEEFLFRGILLHNRIQKSGVFWGVLFTSFIFGMLHPLTFASSFVAGLFFSYLYLYYRNIWIPILAHALMNCIEFVRSYLIAPSVSLNEPLPQLLWVDLLIFTSLTTAVLFIFVFGLVKIHNKLKRQEISY